MINSRPRKLRPSPSGGHHEAHTGRFPVRVRGLLLPALLAFGFLVGSVLSASSARAQAEDNDKGHDLFLEAKCQRCHAVSTVPIEMDEGARVVGPDLSALPSDRRDPVDLEAYILRNETKRGKKHPSAWRGQEQDLRILIGWLLEHQKDPVEDEAP